MRYTIHATLKKVTEDFEKLNFNTAISQMIIVSIYGVIIFREPIFRGARRSAALAFDYKLTCAIVRYGLPSGLHILLDMLTFTFFIFML